MTTIEGMIDVQNRKVRVRLTMPSPCPHIAVLDVIENDAPLAFWSALDPALDAWAEDHLPADATCYAVAIRRRNDIESVRTRTRAVPLQAAGHSFTFTFDVTRTHRPDGSHVVGVFHVYPPRSQPDVLLEYAIYEGLTAWYGQPLETISDPLYVRFSLQHYHYYATRFRIQIADRYYYFSSRFAGGGEFQILTVLTPLAQRDPVLEADIVAALSPHYSGPGSVHTDIMLYSLSGERWTVQR